jgi:hypothetical protein
MLRQAKICPFSEVSSVSFLADVFEVNPVFITPHSAEPAPSLAAFSLLPTTWDTVSGRLQY